MSKLGRLIRGELNKIVMRPIIYVVTGLIVLALFFSVTIMATADRGLYNVSVQGNNKTEVMQTYQSTTSTVSKIKSNQLVTSAQNRLDTYKTINENITLSPTSQLKTMLSEISNYVNNYGSNIQDLERMEPQPTVATTSIKNFRIDILAKLQNLNVYYNNTISDGRLSLMITKKHSDEFALMLSTAINYVTMAGADMALLTTHRNVFDRLTNSSYIELMDQSVRLNMFDIVLPSATVSNIESLSNSINERLIEIDSQIISCANDDTQSLEQLKNNVLNYYYTCQQYSQFVNDTIYYEPIKNMLDSEITNYLNYSNLYKYEIQERLTLNNYLLTNSYTTNQFSSPFTATMSSGDKVSAYDLTYFGLEICGFIILIFCVIIAGGMVAGEQTNGTLKLLMIRPYSRNKIITSKILATLIFGILFVIFSAVVLFIIGIAQYGADNTTILAVFNATTPFLISPLALLFTYIGLLIAKILFYVLLAIMISVVFRSNIGAVIVSALLYFVSALFSVLFTNSYWYSYLPFSNIDLFKYMGGSFASSINNPLAIAFSSPMFHNMNFPISAIIIGASIIILLAIIYPVFRKREIK